MILTLNIYDNAVFAHARADLIGELARVSTSVVSCGVLDEQRRLLRIAAIKTRLIQIKNRIVLQPSDAR